MVEHGQRKHNISMLCMTGLMSFAGIRDVRGAEETMYLLLGLEKKMTRCEFASPAPPKLIKNAKYLLDRELFRSRLPSSLHVTVDEHRTCTLFSTPPRRDEHDTEIGPAERTTRACCGQERRDRFGE